MQELGHGYEGEVKTLGNSPASPYCTQREFKQPRLNLQVQPNFYFVFILLVYGRLALEISHFVVGLVGSPSKIAVSYENLEIESRCQIVIL